jgi:hypothetical protein
MMGQELLAVLVAAVEQQRQNRAGLVYQVKVLLAARVMQVALVVEVAGRAVQALDLLLVLVLPQHILGLL